MENNIFFKLLSSVISLEKILGIHKTLDSRRIPVKIISVFHILFVMSMVLAFSTFWDITDPNKWNTLLIVVQIHHVSCCLDAICYMACSNISAKPYYELFRIIKNIFRQYKLECRLESDILASLLTTACAFLASVFILIIRLHKTLIPLIMVKNVGMSLVCFIHNLHMLNATLTACLIEIIIVYIDRNFEMWGTRQNVPESAAWAEEPRDMKIAPGVLTGATSLDEVYKLYNQAFHCGQLFNKVFGVSLFVSICQIFVSSTYAVTVGITFFRGNVENLFFEVFLYTLIPEALSYVTTMVLLLSRSERVSRAYIALIRTMAKRALLAETDDGDDFLRLAEDAEMRPIVLRFGFGSPLSLSLMPILFDLVSCYSIVLLQNTTIV